MRTVAIAVLLVGCLAALSPGESNRQKMTTYNLKEVAEVSPGQFVKYKEYMIKWELVGTVWSGVNSKESEKEEFYQMDTSYLAIPWGKEEVRWVGVGVPVSLRAWKGQLYLIVFDRETNFSKCKFIYYKQDETRFAEIPPDQYPREIATQNLWLSRNFGRRKDGTVIDEVEIAKDLDPGDPGFRSSITARIWVHLETGKQYYESQFPERAFLEEFLKRHKVEKLTEIDRAASGSAATTQPTTAKDR